LERKKKGGAEAVPDIREIVIQKEDKVSPVEGKKEKTARPKTFEKRKKRFNFPRGKGKGLWNALKRGEGRSDRGPQRKGKDQKTRWGGRKNFPPPDAKRRTAGREQCGKKRGQKILRSRGGKMASSSRNRSGGGGAHHGL